jgi:adenosylhomocysteine nucleosidase
VSESGDILVCFAVKEEAAPFRKSICGKPGLRILVTGMGQRNAATGIGAAFAAGKPKLVLTCGFAGALTPELREGQIIFATKEAALGNALTAEGGRPVRFHCDERVAATVKEKQLLRRETGCDAVEMESGAICGFCEGREVTSATVRVVLDEAGQDLPLDFNRVMTDKMEVDYFMLTLALVRRPGIIAGLVRFQTQARRAAERLAAFLVKAIDRFEDEAGAKNET